MHADLHLSDASSDDSGHFLQGDGNVQISVCYSHNMSSVFELGRKFTLIELHCVSETSLMVEFVLIAESEALPIEDCSIKVLSSRN